MPKKQIRWREKVSMFDVVASGCVRRYKQCDDDFFFEVFESEARGSVPVRQANNKGQH